MLVLIPGHGRRDRFLDGAYQRRIGRVARDGWQPGGVSQLMRPGEQRDRGASIASVISERRDALAACVRQKLDIVQHTAAVQNTSLLGSRNGA